jgi:hypothetical protein
MSKSCHNTHTGHPGFREGRSLMTYKEKFSASEQKAHNRFIATKIHKEMSELRAGVDTSPTTPRRWVWELIQNAKDAKIGGKVCVRIQANLDDPDGYVNLTHNGGAFSAENIRFLIEQVSSKDRTKDSAGRPKSTGKFGTGFLTTHLLSECVLVTGVVKEQGLTPRKFELSLDRSGVELEDIIAAVEAAKVSIQDLDERPHYKEYADGKFNTSFRYELADNTGKKVARAGLRDLDICLPYMLAFVREIESVEYPNRIVTVQDPDDPRTDGEVQFVSVTSTDTNGGTKTYSIAVQSINLTTIAIPIEHTDEGVHILPLAPEVPRLFCDFPLLGTESFPFPVIVNNPTFNPTEPRDGVFLTKTERSEVQSDHNRTIIEEALDLYLRLLDYASENDWQNLSLLAAAKPMPELIWADQKWYNSEVLKPLRTVLLRTNIVRTAADTMAPIRSPDGATNIWFPSGPTTEIRRRIWCCYKPWIPEQLPAQSDVEVWHDIIWSDCGKLTLDQFAEFIEDVGTIEMLVAKLPGTDAYAWLNDFYATLMLDESARHVVVTKRRIFPNQNGTFCRKADLSRDAGDIDAALLDILKLLGNNLRDYLLAPEIETDLVGLSMKDGGFVVKEITATIEKHINDRGAMQRFRPALDKLLRWFHENTAHAKSLFPMLYENKHKLYDDEEILGNIERAGQLNELLNEYNLKTIDELRAVIEKKTTPSELLPVTQQIIACLGITSVEEWHEALKDKNLAALFSHESAPTLDMFVYAQSLIQKAKDRVKSHLSKLDEYDLTDLDETAITILAGVRKNNREVTIVVRPAYDGTVIIYYQSERDVLDYEDHELWVDSGKDVRRITFGHILKKTDIRRFPI